MPIFDILQDFHNTLAILPPDHPEMVAVTALSRAIDAGSHILKADPTLFIQQMRNELVWSWGEETKLGQALRSAAGRYKRTWLKRLTPSRVTTDSAFLRALSGHRGRVWSVAFAPDGQTLASGGVDRTVRLWDTQTGAERLTLEGHHGRIASVAFAPDSQMVASGSEDGTVRLWDVQKGEEKRVIEGHCGRIWSVAFAPDGQMVVSGSEDGTVRLWDTHTGTERQVLQGHRRGVSSVAFAPDGQIVASGSEDGT